MGQRPVRTYHGLKTKKACARQNWECEWSVKRVHTRGAWGRGAGGEGGEGGAHLCPANRSVCDIVQTTGAVRYAGRISPSCCTTFKRYINIHTQQKHAVCGAMLLVVHCGVGWGDWRRGERKYYPAYRTVQALAPEQALARRGGMAPPGKAEGSSIHDTSYPFDPPPLNAPPGDAATPFAAAAGAAVGDAATATVPGGQDINLGRILPPITTTNMPTTCCANDQTEAVR